MVHMRERMELLPLVRSADHSHVVGMLSPFDVTHPHSHGAGIERTTTAEPARKMLKHPARAGCVDATGCSHSRRHPVPDEARLASQREAK